MQEEPPVAPKQWLRPDENAANPLPKDAVGLSARLPPVTTSAAIATPPRTQAVTDDPLVFDLTDGTCMPETEDFSHAIVCLQRTATERSKTVVMRLKSDLELSAHDVWTLQEPTADIESSVLDAWGLLLGQNLHNRARIVSCNIFSRFHELVSKKTRKGRAMAASVHNEAIKKFVTENNVGSSKRRRPCS